MLRRRRNWTDPATRALQLRTRRPTPSEARLARTAITQRAKTEEWLDDELDRVLRMLDLHEEANA